MTEKQFKEITEWQDKTFPNSTALSKVAHLKQEVLELESDLKTDSDHLTTEWADCAILLFGAAKCAGMNYSDCLNAIQDKFEVNKLRTWGKPDENGVVNHIKN